jgi:hypothetical protein
MNRKSEQYRRWRGRNGEDAVVEHALEEVQDIELTRRGSRIAKPLPLVVS